MRHHHQRHRLIFVLTLLLTAGAVMRPPTVRALTTFFTVTSLGDDNTRDDVLTLREAMLIANRALGFNTTQGPALTAGEKASLSGCSYDGAGYITQCGFPGYDNIRFSSLFAGGASYIRLLTPLPILSNEGTSIAGTTPAGDVLQIVIDGQSLPDNADIFRIERQDASIFTGNNIVIEHLTLVNAAASAISIYGGQGAIIDKNVIGTTTSDLCDTTRPTRNGVVIQEQDGSALAGAGAAYIFSNWIGCTTNDAIFVSSSYVYIGADSAGNLPGNMIGVSTGGDGSLANSNGIVVGDATSHDNYIEHNDIEHNTNVGVWITGGAHNNSVSSNSIRRQGSNGLQIDGGAFANQISGNLISANAAEGISISDSTTVGNVVAANRIGTRADAEAADGNGDNGIVITNGASGNIIGTTNQPNIISGNTASGVFIAAGAHDTTLTGNTIGLDFNGFIAVPNGAAGIALFAGVTNTLINSGPISTQRIAGNLREGIYIENASMTTVSDGVDIGTTSGSGYLGNGREGILLSGASNSSISPRQIYGNGLAGVALVGTTTGIRVFPGADVGNGGLPIDLNNDGPTPNDPGDTDSGPNTLLNYPVITTAYGTTIAGTACGSCTVLLYAAIGDPRAARGGGEQMGGHSILVNPDGTWSSTVPVGTRSVTAITCQSSCEGTANSTSEMSPAVVVLPEHHLYLPLVTR